MSNIDPAKLQALIDSLGGDAADAVKSMGNELLETVKNAVEEERKNQIVDLAVRLSTYIDGNVKKQRFIRREARKAEEERDKLKALAAKLFSGDSEAWENIEEKMEQHRRAYVDPGPSIPSASSANTLKL